MRKKLFNIETYCVIGVICGNNSLRSENRFAAKAAPANN